MSRTEELKASLEDIKKKLTNCPHDDRRGLYRQYDTIERAIDDAIQQEYQLRCAYKKEFLVWRAGFNASFLYENRNCVEWGELEIEAAFDRWKLKNEIHG